MIVLSVVVPCYNEEEVLEKSSTTLLEVIDRLVKIKKISEKSRIVFVDDGSTDNTWNIISGLKNDYFAGIKLSKNCGHQNALVAGLETMIDVSDAIVTIDADLQDDVDCIEAFIDEYERGSDVVYGIRSSRISDSFLKRSSAELYYKILKLLGANIRYNHADYRLMSKRAVMALLEYKEVNLFLRGIVPMVGFKSSEVFYSRKKREAGHTKYPLSKMISFAIDGVTSLSITPINMIFYMGFLCLVISVCILIYAIIGHYNGGTISGWTSLIISIWGLGGLQLMSLGIIGKYVGKTYLETKNRPRYIIENKTLNLVRNDDEE